MCPRPVSARPQPRLVAPVRVAAPRPARAQSARTQRDSVPKWATTHGLFCQEGEVASKKLIAQRMKAEDLAKYAAEMEAHMMREKEIMNLKPWEFVKQVALKKQHYSDIFHSKPVPSALYCAPEGELQPADCRHKQRPGDTRPVWKYSYAR